MTRLAYLGTPSLGVPPLEALVEAGHEVRIVVTGPDRRRGRGNALSPSPVKQAARALGIRVSERMEAVAEAGADLGVVVAYGRLIPKDVLDSLPMLNLHFSLLPRWRGAAPLERAILAGDDVTGICVMGVEPGLDTGPVYASRRIEIGADEHLVHLRDRMAVEGARLLVDLFSAPLPSPVPQAGEPSYAKKITAEDLELDWTKPAADLSRVVRLDGAWTAFRGRRLRILAARTAGDPPGGVRPGTLVGAVVAAGDGALLLERVQPAGRPAMDAPAWLRGVVLRPGEVLGE